MLQPGSRTAVISCRLKRHLDKLSKQSDDDYSVALGIMSRIVARNADNEADWQKLYELRLMIEAAIEEMAVLQKELRGVNG